LKPLLLRCETVAALDLLSVKFYCRLFW